MEDEFFSIGGVVFDRTTDRLFEQAIQREIKSLKRSYRDHGRIMFALGTVLGAFLAYIIIVRL